MGLTLDGWVEFNDQIRWKALIRIGALMGGMGSRYPMCLHFFYGKDAVIGCRGLPKDVSKTVMEELAALPETGCNSWMTAKELLLIDWNLITDEWQLLYDLVDRLVQTYGEEKVRLVTWFSY